MKSSTASITLPCTISEFWKVYLNREYLNQLYIEELGYKRFEILELTDTTRKLLIVPKMSLPAAVESLIGESFMYEDHGSLDVPRDVWTWSMVPGTDAKGKTKRELVRTSGTVRAEALPEGGCRRTDDIRIESKVFGLGGLIEASAEKELQATQPKEHAFMRRWIEERRA